MKKISTYGKSFLVLVALMVGLTIQAQNMKLYGVRQNMRYDDGDDAKSTYLGWDAAAGKAIFSGDYGLWQLNATANKVESSLVHYDNLMFGNSGSVYINGYIYTVFSHENPDESSAPGEMEFVVRKWDAKTYEKVSEKRFPKSANLESRGMAYNPQDGKVYGLFYLTDVALPEIEGYEPDPDDIDMGQTGDAGYAVCTIDLETMELKQITPGIYYENYVTFACSPDGRLYSMTSGGSLCEFSAKTGLLVQQGTKIYEGEEEPVYFMDNCGYQSQFRRQAACFDHNTGKMYWNGYINSGKGINDWGSWSTLSDKEWRTNGKYDTALYEVDLTTGKATQIAKIPNRLTFSCLWVDGADGTDVVPTAVESVENAASDIIRVYNASGMCVGSNLDNLTRGMYIVKQGNVTKKVMKK